MANKVLIQEMDGTPRQICFADFAGDFNPDIANDLRHPSAVDTECQLNLATLADAAAMQSSKVDLGVNRAEAYKCRAAIEWAATPTSGEQLELHWAPSQSPTAANANAGGVSGVAGVYAGTGADTMAAAVKQLDFIGVSTCTDDITGAVQITEVGVFSPSSRYGSLVVRNESGAAIHADDVQCHCVMDPVVVEVQ